MATIPHHTACDAAVNLARQSLYRFAAISLLDPKARSWEQLDPLRGDGVLTDAAALIRRLPDATPKRLALGERPLDYLAPEHVLAKLPDSPQALNDQYEKTFGLLVCNACPPYETEYVNSKFTFQRSHLLADVSGFYQAFGLSTSSQHPERADHVVLQLEFMAVLLGLQRQAEESDAALRAQRVRVCRDAQGRFLKEHLAWWLPAFAKLLARESAGEFYESVGVFLSALIPAERALMHVEPASQLAAPSNVDRPDACEGCQLTE